MHLFLSNLKTSPPIFHPTVIQSPVTPLSPTSIYESSVTLKEEGVWKEKKKETDHEETYWSIRRGSGKIIMEAFAFIQRRENGTEAPEIMIFIQWVQSIFRDSELPYESSQVARRYFMCT